MNKKNEPSFCTMLKFAKNSFLAHNFGSSSHDNWANRFYDPLKTRATKLQTRSPSFSNSTFKKQSIEFSLFSYGGNFNIALLRDLVNSEVQRTAPVSREA